MLKQQDNPQNVVFRVLDAVPGQLWYILGVGSILASLILQISGKKNWADFVGKWPPTFFIIGLYHKLLQPGQEDAMGALQQTKARVEHNIASMHDTP
jgi:hypothetical protein